MPEWIKAIATIMTIVWLVILILATAYWVLMIGLEVLFKVRKDDDDEEGKEE